MPDSIGIMFDGWSTGSTYYVGVYAIYVVENSPRRVLLAFAPLLEKNDFGADAHITFITETLAVFGKRPDCLRFIVGDNCTTNQAIATRMGLPRVGCASHQLNLAIQQHLAEHDALLSQVNEPMCQLRTKNNAGTLRKYTDLRPVKRIVTRWSSTFKMENRFLRIKDAAKHVEAVEELVPRSRDCRRLMKLQDDLQALDSICLKLQSNETTLADVRTLFDGVVKRYPGTSNYLTKDATIVHRTKLVRVVGGGVGERNEFHEAAHAVLEGEHILLIIGTLNHGHEVEVKQFICFRRLQSFPEQTRDTVTSRRHAM
ncbi:unnamed protein product [Phytophthora fragariaefolia]|uniref:Unnamed protein product n=1 Tax=Phytophthora fragariaefolia TaxID=1490495 RepID=A0A9W6YCJ8_9STRA|nr:unnamed protein product [Phytophthora fragariaefolia]